MLGREIHTRVEDGAGRIIDLLADNSGQVRAAVIEFGGFLGIGTRKIAVEWSALRFERDGKQPAVIVDMTRDQLRMAPEYKPNEPAVVRKVNRVDVGRRRARVEKMRRHGRRGLRDSDEESALQQRTCRRERVERGLDWFTFFVADLQTGFGPFLSVYLTTQKWTQVDIGLVLSMGSIAGLLCQVPGGWIVDAARSKRRAAMLAVIGIGVSRAADRGGAGFRDHRCGKAPARGLRARCWGRPSPPSPWASSGHAARGPSGSAATRALPRSATVLQPASWAPAAISCRHRRCSS